MLALSYLLLLLVDHREQSFPAQYSRKECLTLSKTWLGQLLPQRQGVCVLNIKYRRYINFLIVPLLNGFMAFIKEGEWSMRSIMNLPQSLWNVRQGNIQGVMGYIIDLTLILNDIFRVGSGNASASDIHWQSAVDKHVRSDCRDQIHREIRSFVTETFAIGFSVPQRDLILERITELIRRYCRTG